MWTDPGRLRTALAALLVGSAILFAVGIALSKDDLVPNSQKLVNQGFVIPPRERQTPQALAAYQKAEIEKWWPVIKAAGIKSE